VKHIVEKGKSLLIDGPSSVTLISGEAEILGAPFKTEERIVIREGKRIPFEIVERSEFNIVLGENTSFEEIDGSTILSSWVNASEEILSVEKSLSIMVIGNVDSGKSSFCTYVANKALEKGFKVAVIDADLGQSDVGPPATIGFSRILAPVKDLFEVEVESACFIGLTSPSRVTVEVIEKLSSLKSIALRCAVDLLIINTDGWVEGEEATAFKLNMVEELAPDIVVGMQRENDLAPILSGLKERMVLTVESPPVIRVRDREKRKILRELSYKKYLKDAKIQSYPLTWINVEGAFLKVRNQKSEILKELRQLLGISPLYLEETSNNFLVVLRKSDWIDKEVVKKIETDYGKRVKIIREGDEEGLLVAFQDADRVFLGIGIIESIDYKRMVMKVFTSVYKNVATVLIGQIKLDKNGREYGIDPVFD
jgi:polynucleotide 5'-hydroxyl-kinase GRC3/NOL9